MNLPPKEGQCDVPSDLEMVTNYVRAGDYIRFRGQALALISEDPATAERLRFVLVLAAISDGDFCLARKIVPDMVDGWQKGIAAKILEFRLGQGIGAARARQTRSSLTLDVRTLLLALIDQEDWARLFAQAWYHAKIFRSQDNPDGDFALQCLCYAMVKMNLKHALVQELQNWQGDPESLGYAALRSYVLYFDRKHDEVVSLGKQYQPAALTFPNDPFYSMLFEFHADCLLRTGRSADLPPLLEAEQALNGESSWWLLFSGLLDFTQDRPAAIKKWEASAFSNSFCLNHSWGVNSFRLRDSFRFHDENFVPLPGGADLRCGAPVVVSCADERYLRQFLPNIVLNILRNPDVLWHYHFILVVSDARTRKIIDFLNCYKNVSISIERCTSHPPRAYFTLPRFAVTRALLRQGVRRVIMTDVDVLVKDVPAALASLGAETGAGLVFSGFYYHFPWHGVQINLSTYDGSVGSIAVIERMVRWIEQAYDPNHGYQWWIDQVAVTIARTDPALSGHVFKLDGAFRGQFRFAGSSPALKEAFVAEIVEHHPEVLELLKGWL